MAVQTLITDVSVRLVFNGGMDMNGKPVLKKTSCTKESSQMHSLKKVHEAAIALASLQTYTLDAVQMLSTNDVAQA
ncbi:hypothetical protein GCM10020331_025580 [Ectobacillus funiculus]